MRAQLQLRTAHEEAGVYSLPSRYTSSPAFSHLLRRRVLVGIVHRTRLQRLLSQRQTYLAQLLAHL